MIRHLTTLVLGGILGSMILVGNAEACHKNKCNRGCASAGGLRGAGSGTLRSTCGQVCAIAKHCFKISLPKFCRKRSALPPTPVCYAVASNGLLCHPPGFGSALERHPAPYPPNLMTACTSHRSA